MSCHIRHPHSPGLARLPLAGDPPRPTAPCARAARCCPTRPPTPPTCASSGWRGTAPKSCWRRSGARRPEGADVRLPASRTPLARHRTTSLQPHHGMHALRLQHGRRPSSPAWQPRSIPSCRHHWPPFVFSICQPSIFKRVPASFVCQAWVAMRLPLILCPGCAAHVPLLFWEPPAQPPWLGGKCTISRALVPAMPCHALALPFSVCPPLMNPLFLTAHCLATGPCVNACLLTGLRIRNSSNSKGNLFLQSEDDAAWNQR